MLKDEGHPASCATIQTVRNSFNRCNYDKVSSWGIDRVDEVLLHRAWASGEIWPPVITVVVCSDCPALCSAMNSTRLVLVDIY